MVKVVSKVSIMGALIFFSCSTAVMAEGIKYPLPEKTMACSSSQTMNIANRESRDMAFVSRNWWFESVTLFDIEEGCTVAFRFTGLCPPKSEGVKAACRLGEGGYQPGTVFRVKAYPQQLVHRFLEAYELTGRGSSDYNQWKADEAKRKEELKIAQEEAAEKAKEQRELNREIHIALPRYTAKDANLLLAFDRGALDISNLSQEFITVTSISTYYNDNINTISGASLELPPESKKSRAYTISELFSTQMNAVVKVKDLDAVKKKKTKLGFAIKYVVNGAEKRIYSVKEYDNNELLKDLK